MATSIDQLRGTIAARAAADPSFRYALLRRPKETLEELLGTALPKDLKVTVVEDSSANTYLVVPKPASDADALIRQ